MPRYGIRRTRKTRKSRKPTQKDIAKAISSVVGHGAYQYSAPRSRIPRVRGRGDYKSILGGIMKGAGAIAGGLMGGLPGATKGLSAGAALSSALGFGDYKVRVNSLIHPSMDDQVPNVGNGRGSIRVRHREYLGDVFGSKNFHNLSYQINPANQNTFPWLSQIALNFEQWRPLGMIFEFRTMSSDTQISTSTALGTVVLATEYNSLAPGFVSKQSMENSQFVVSTKPSCSVMHPIECDLSQTPNQPLYVRLPSSSSGDARLYDLGNFQIATQGMLVDDSNQGELWLSYDIEFYKPIIGSVSGTQVQFGHAYQNQTVGDCSSNYPFGSPASYLHNVSSGLAISIFQLPTSGSQISFNPQFPAYEAPVLVKLIWQINALGAFTLAPPGFTVQNCTLLPVNFGLTGQWNTTGANSIQCSFYLVPTDYGVPFALVADSTGTLDNGTVFTSLDIYVTEINAAVIPSLVSSAKVEVIEDEGKKIDDVGSLCLKQKDEIEVLKQALEKYRESDRKIQEIVDRVTIKKS